MAEGGSMADDNMPNGYCETVSSLYSNENFLEGIKECEILKDCKELPEVFCKNCKKMLCKDCVRYHSAFHKDHDIEPLPNSVVPKLSFTKIAQSTVVCKHYLQKHLDLFCTRCQMLICKECSNGDHSGHKVVNPEMATVETEDLYKEILEGCEEKFNKSTENINELGSLLETHEEHVQMSIKQYSEFVDKLKQELESKREIQINKFRSECNLVKNSIQSQIEFWTRQQEAEKHLEVLINLFDKDESRMHWLALRKPFLSMWKMMQTQQPPSFKKPGLGNFVPNEKLLLCVKEMSVGNLQISPSVTSQKRELQRSGSTLTDETLTLSFIHTDQSVCQSVEKVDLFPQLKAHEEIPVFYEPKAEQTYKTVVDFEGTNKKSNVTFDPETKTLHVRVSDKDRKKNKYVSESSFNAYVSESPYQQGNSDDNEIYADIPLNYVSHPPSLPPNPHPPLPPIDNEVNFVDVRDLHKSSSMNNILDINSSYSAPALLNMYGSDTNLSTGAPPVPPRRRRKSRPPSDPPHALPNLPTLVPELSDTKKEATPVETKVKNKMSSLLHFRETLSSFRRSSII